MSFYQPFGWLMLATAFVALTVVRKGRDRPWGSALAHLFFAMLWAGTRWEELRADPERTAVAAGVSVAAGLVLPWLLPALAAWVGRGLGPLLARTWAPAASAGGGAGRAAVRLIAPYWPRLTAFQFALWLILGASVVALVLGLGPLLLR